MHLRVENLINQMLLVTKIIILWLKANSYRRVIYFGVYEK